MELTTKRSLTRWATLGCLTCLLMSGCATAGTPAPHALGVGEWQARLPTSKSPIAELAYGTPNYGALPESDALATLDQAMLDRTTEAKALRRSRYVRSIHRSPQAAPSAIAEAQPTLQVEAKAETPKLSMSAEPAPAQLPASALAQNDVGSRYAERENQAQQQQQFRGGDAIVISAGAILVVLLIVILILLLR